MMKLKEANKIATFALLGSLAGFSFTGCGGDRPNPETLRQEGLEQVNSEMLTNTERLDTRAARLGCVTDMGNGVYVFPAKYFPETIADFKEAHPELRVVCWSQGRDNEGGIYGIQSGAALTFVVNTEPVPALQNDMQGQN